jgi:hypothetical protein
MPPAKHWYRFTDGTQPDLGTFFAPEDVWPVAYRHLLKRRYHDVAVEMQAQAKADNLEIGWYTARNPATGRPRIIRVPVEFQSRGPNSQSFRSPFLPSEVIARYGVVNLVWHHVHGNFSAGPSRADYDSAMRYNPYRIAYAQHGQAGDEPTLYSHLFGPAQIFVPPPPPLTS